MNDECFIILFPRFYSRQEVYAGGVPTLPFLTFPQGCAANWSIAEKINVLHVLYYSAKPCKVNVEGHHCIVWNMSAAAIVED